MLLKKLYIGIIINCPHYKRLVFYSVDNVIDDNILKIKYNVLIISLKT